MAKVIAKGFKASLVEASLDSPYAYDHRFWSCWLLSVSGSSGETDKWSTSGYS
jgi:hypothetical protein